MAATCRGICVESKADIMSNRDRYKKGQKRCTFCCLYLKTAEIRCPCCKKILRTKPRSKSKR